MPAERQQAERAKTAAEKTITEKTAAYRVAEDVLANYDRPLHRRKHATEIAAGTTRHRTTTSSREDRRQRTQRRGQQARTLPTGGGASEGEPAPTPRLRDRRSTRSTSQLDHDLRIRTRITRLERPDAIVNTLGDRPAPGPAARQWDAAAGRLAQHQAAFNITDGLGPHPNVLDHSAYSRSRDDVVAAVEPLEIRRSPVVTASRTWARTVDRANGTRTTYR